MSYPQDHKQVWGGSQVVCADSTKSLFVSGVLKEPQSTHITCVMNSYPESRMDSRFVTTFALPLVGFGINQKAQVIKVSLPVHLPLSMEKEEERYQADTP